MSESKCEICGGTVVINIQSGVCVCDSCGNSAAIDREVFRKYKQAYETAQMKMKMNSAKAINDAIEILNSIPFVDGAEADLRVCRQRLEEINTADETRKKAAEQTDADNGRLGAVFVAILIVSVIALIAALCFVGYKLIKGELTPAQTYICVGVGVLALIAFIAGKING